MNFKKLAFFSYSAALLIATTACTRKPKPIVERVVPTIREETSEHADQTPFIDNLRRQKLLATATDVFRPIYFAYDQAGLTEEAKSILSNINAFMREAPEISFTIEGHCDEKGTNEYNLALGERRARTVYDYLNGLESRSSAMKTISYGEERPAQEGHDDEARKLNRRASFALDI